MTEKTIAKEAREAIETGLFRQALNSRDISGDAISYIIACFNAGEKTLK